MVFRGRNSMMVAATTLRPYLKVPISGNAPHCLSGRESDSGDGAPIPMALGAVLDDEAKRTDPDLASGQALAESGDERCGRLMRSAVADGDVRNPRLRIIGEVVPTGDQAGCG